MWYRNKPLSVVKQVIDYTESENNSGWSGPLETSSSTTQVSSPSKVDQVAQGIVHVSFEYL